MAIGIQNFPNIIPADDDYLSGRIKDNPGDGSGTPVNQLTNGDIHEFFAWLMNRAGIIPNGLPDNEYSGHQFIKALNVFGNNHLSTDIIKGLIGTYTTNDLIILWGCSIVANIPGTSTITEGAIYYNNVIYKVASASIPSPSNTLIFSINPNTDLDSIQLSNGISGSGIADYNSSSVKDLIPKWVTMDNSSGATFIGSGGATASFFYIKRRYLKSACGRSVTLMYDASGITLTGGTGFEIKIDLPINTVASANEIFAGSVTFISLTPYNSFAYNKNNSSISIEYTGSFSDSVGVNVVGQVVYDI